MRMPQEMIAMMQQQMGDNPMKDFADRCATSEPLGKETIEVPAGTFQCVVVEPIIKTSGLFGDGGQAEIYFTDDDRRLMVYMKSRVKILPDIHLRLKEIG